MSKNYLLVAYAILVVIICTLIGCKIGYSMKHPPVYIYVKYNNSVNKNLATAFKQAEIDAGQHQIETLARILKAGERVAR